MSKKIRKSLSLLLTIAMILSMVPFGALAYAPHELSDTSYGYEGILDAPAENQEENKPIPDYDLEYSSDSYSANESEYDYYVDGVVEQESYSASVFDSFTINIWQMVDGVHVSNYPFSTEVVHLNSNLLEIQNFDGFEVVVGEMQNHILDVDGSSHRFDDDVDVSPHAFFMMNPVGGSSGHGLYFTTTLIFDLMDWLTGNNENFQFPFQVLNIYANFVCECENEGCEYCFDECCPDCCDGYDECGDP